MKSISGNILLVAICLAVSVLLAMPASSLSADMTKTKTKTQEMLKLQDCVIDDLGMSESELSWYEPVIKTSLKLNGGDAEPVREMFQKAVGDGCVGDCLMKRLRNWNRAMKQEQKQLYGEGKVTVWAQTGEEDGDHTQARTRTRDDEDCEPVGDANKNRHEGDKAGDLTGDSTASEAVSESGDQDQTRTRDDEDCEPVGDENKNRKGE